MRSDTTEILEIELNGTLEIEFDLSPFKMVLA